ncbi:MAG: hypothetical protein KAJ73_07035 [Zetaproteobacteria bacterium]|nr:hypothetical protein [Zetaproteobacteria bacterium]
MSDQPKQATQNSQMTSEIDTLEKSVKRVNELVENLNVRLKPVLREEGSPPRPEEADEQNLVTYAHRIRTIRRIADDVIYDLEGILAQLEV